jgi:uncharacterized protein (TIGR02996 family)
MGHEDILLQDVIDTPDDDGPRLQFADWRESQGDIDRAEFIRLQCGLASLRQADPGRAALVRREGELLREHGVEWAEELGPRVTEWVFRRGFVERVEMGLETSAGAIVEVLRKAPIRHIRDTTQLCDLDGVVEALPYLDRLTGLEFWELYAVESKLVDELLSSPHLGNLRTLILHHDRNGNLVPDKVLIKAMASPYRANLEELAVNVDGCWRGPSSRLIRAMAKSPHLGNLRSLTLSYAALDVTTVDLIARSPALARLERLDLGGCAFTDEVWEAILALPQLSRLRWIRLSRTRLVDAKGKQLGYISPVPEIVRDLVERVKPEYAATFERLAKAVDWETEMISPDLGTCWKGLTRTKGRRA